MMSSTNFYLSFALAVTLASQACGGGTEPDFHRRPARDEAATAARPTRTPNETGGSETPPETAETSDVETRGANETATETPPSETADSEGAGELPGSEGEETAMAAETAPNAETAAPAGASDGPAEISAPHPALSNPEAANETAPSQFVAELDTTAGPVRIEVHRDWSPNGADRFYNLVRIGYFTDVAFFRVIDGFMAQTGIHGDPGVSARWRSANIPDDPVIQHNTRGMVSFAMAGPGSRTTQFFISLVDNQRLDGMGFAPFGRVLDMTAVDRLNSEYGEGAPSGRGPAQMRIQTEGNRYLRADFPRLDYIRSARIVSSS